MEKLIFIHIGKTGGSFVRTVVDFLLVRGRLGPFQRLFNFRAVLLLNGVRRRVVASLGSELPKRLPVLLSNPERLRPHGFLHVHDRPPANWRTVPGRRFTVVRHPLDHIVSQYEYQRTVPEVRDGMTRSVPDSVLQGYAIPREGDCRFPDWLRFFYEYKLPLRVRNELGVRADEMQTGIGFWCVWHVKYLMKNPSRVVKRMSREYLASGDWKRELMDVEILKFENLNEDLHDFLVASGMDPRRVAFLKKDRRTRINVSPGRKGRHWRAYYDDALLEYVLDHEWPLFLMFPEIARDDPDITRIVGELAAG